MLAGLAGDADAQLAALDAGRLAHVVAVVDDLDGERLPRHVLLEGACDVEQPRIAAERQGDAVLDGETGGLPRVLDRVDDLLRQPLAAKPLVERELQRDRVEPSRSSW